MTEPQIGFATEQEGLNRCVVLLRAFTSRWAPRSLSDEREFSAQLSELLLVTHMIAVQPFAEAAARAIAIQPMQPMVIWEGPHVVKNPAPDAAQGPALAPMVFSGNLQLRGQE